MNINNDVLSIVVPAYNKPDLLHRQLSSILKQSYRPFEIIISDDCSPNSLENVVSIVKTYSDQQVSIKFTRQSKNLGAYWNVLYCLNQVTGKYLLFAPHDDWFIDGNFISDAIHAIRSQDDCYVAIANSAVENMYGEGMHGLMMNLFWEPGTPQWSYINGGHFITKHLYASLHPSYSAVILNYEILKRLDYLSFFIPKDRLLEIAGTSKIDFEPDEAFIGINLLAFQGQVAISGKAVSFRGNPPDSWSKSAFWRANVSFGLFIPNFYLYRFYKDVGFKEGKKLMLKLLIGSSVTKLNMVILRYLSFDRDAFFIMMLSVLWFYLSRLGLDKPLKVLLKLSRKAFDPIWAKK